MNGYFRKKKEKQFQKRRLNWCVYWWSGDYYDEKRGFIKHYEPSCARAKTKRQWKQGYHRKQRRYENYLANAQRDEEIGNKVFSDWWKID